MITLVAAMSENRVIGVNNTIPWHIPEDFAHFKKYTIGKTLIMGRKTYESIGKPLPQRTTIVITHNKDWHTDDNIIIVNNINDAIKIANGDEIIIAGGGNLYEQFIDIADKIVLSIIPTIINNGDSFFPIIDSAHWTLSEIDEKEKFKIATYIRK